MNRDLSFQMQASCPLVEYFGGERALEESPYIVYGFDERTPESNLEGTGLPSGNAYVGTWERWCVCVCVVGREMWVRVSPTQGVCVCVCRRREKPRRGVFPSWDQVP